MKLSYRAEDKRAAYNIALYVICFAQFLSFVAVIALHSTINVEFTTGLFSLMATYLSGALFVMMFDVPSIQKRNAQSATTVSMLTYTAYAFSIFYPEPYLLIPAGAFVGIGEVCFWPCAVLFALHIAKSFAGRHSSILYYARTCSFLLLGCTVCSILGNIFTQAILLRREPSEDYRINVTSSVDNLRYSTTTCEGLHCNETVEYVEINDVNSISYQMTLYAATVIMARIVFLTVATFMCKSYWSQDNMCENGELMLEKNISQIKSYDHVMEPAFVVIKVGGVQFNCNRHVLSRISGYFRTLFRNTAFKENYTGEIVVTGPHGDELSPQIMHLILGFAYTKHINLTNDNVYDLSIAADYLEIEELQAICVSYLKSLITYQTWTSIFRFASQLCLAQLMSACMNNFQKVYNKLDLRQYHVSEFKAILKVQKKKMTSTRVFEAILFWVNSIKQERKRYFDDLLQYVDFKSMDVKYVSDKICSEEVIAERPDIVTNICRTMANRRLLIIGGFTKKAERSAVKYCPDSKTFVPCNNAPNHCHASAFALHDNKVIVAGGTGNAFDIQIYDVDSDTWKVHKSLLSIPRCYAGASIIDDRLYLLGGWDIGEKTRVNSVEVFDIHKGGFSRVRGSTIPFLKDARTDHAVVSRNDEIFAIGGFDNNENYLRSCEVINTSTKERYNISPLNEGRSHMAAVVLDDRIIVIGGKCGVFDKLASVECYSFETDTWTYLPAMRTARMGHCACVHDGKVFVIGGQRTRLIESYDPATRTWQSHQRIHIPRWGSSVVQIVASNITV